MPGGGTHRPRRVEIIDQGVEPIEKEVELIDQSVEPIHR
jgi:hypothetical protein